MLIWHYQLRHPSPTSKFLKFSMVTEALVSFASICDNEISLPASVRCLPKSGKGGQFIKDLFSNEVAILQVCLACLKDAPVNRHVIIYVPESCSSLCKECWETKPVCPPCAANGHTSYYPAMRAGTTCLRKESKCIKAAVFVYTTDCEEGSKKTL